VSSSAAFDQKEQVRQATDIVDLIGSYLTVQHRGRNYVALCPWHNDTRPSLQINRERQTWKCWVCDIGGDVFSFVMRRENVEFREALELLADRAGITLRAGRGTASVKPGSPDDKRNLFQAHAWAEQQFHSCLCNEPEAEAARRYLHERGIDQSSIRRFHLGFSPDRWQWLLDRARSTAFSPQVLAAAGLVAKSEQSGNYYDRFRGRLLFSIRDAQGRPIAVGGRVLPGSAEQAKYVNSPETRLFSKSDQLYGLDLARDTMTKTREAVVVEGYTDVIMAHQCGVGNVVAVLGTALGPRHVQVLRRYADRITLVLDGDEAGQRRTNEVLELFVAEQIDLRVLTLPAGLDPCDYLLEHGGDGFRALVQTAVDALAHRVRIATQNIDPVRDLHAASQALEDILATLAKAPRLKSGSDPAVRLREQRMLARLAREFALEETEIRQRLTQLRQTPRPLSRAREPSPEPAAQPATLDARSRELFEILALKPQLVPRALAVISPDDLPAGPAREIYQVYCDLTAAGEYADAARILTEIEDLQLKNLLATVDWEGHDKAVEALASPESRLDELLNFFARDRDEQRLRDVRHGRVTEKEAEDTLLRFLEEERSRQGLSAPTDG
jgi:DNA primase